MLSRLTPSEVQELARARVMARLADKTLTPRALANEKGISRSSLYRLLSSSENVHGFIRNVRLEAAREAMQTPVSRRGRVLNIATAHGFKSRHAFWRAYRMRFSHAPRVTPPRDLFPTMLSREEPDRCEILRNLVGRAGHRDDVASRPPICPDSGPD